MGFQAIALIHLSVAIMAVMVEGQKNQPPKTYMEQATDLQSKLFKNYSGTVRPVKNAKTDGPISIDLYFQVTHIEEVNERQETLTFHAFLAARWKDYYLKWNPTDYPMLDPHIKLSNFNADKIWAPFFMLMNLAEGFANGFRYPSKEVYVHWTGEVQLRMPMKLKVTCDFDFTLFPYDSQACPVVFRIPFFNLREVSFRAAPTDVSLSWYPDRYNSGYNRDRMKEKTLSAGWEVINVTGGIQYLKWYQQKVSYVQTIPDEHDLGSAWPFFVFRVRLKRFQSYVGMLLMMPFVFTSLLTLISFFITDYSTVVLVVVSNLILQALYLLELLKVTPLSSGTVPGVVSFFGLNFCSTFVTFLIVFAICTIEDCKNPPTGLTRAADWTARQRDYLAKLILKRRQENAENDPNPPSVAKVQKDFAFALRISTFFLMAIWYFYGVIAFLCP